jgi:hypothetical protein
VGAAVTRIRKSDPVVATPPKAPKVPVEDRAGTWTERLIVALLLRRLAHRGVAVGSLATIRKQVARARAELAKTDDGAKQATAIKAAIEGAGPLVRAAQLAGVESRSSAITAAKHFVSWTVEHAGILESPSACARLMSAARWTAAEASIHEGMLVKPLAGKELAEALKLADRASTAARYDLGEALRIHREAKAAKPPAYPMITYPVDDVLPVANPEPVDDDEDDQDGGAPDLAEEPADDEPDRADEEPTPVVVPVHVATEAAVAPPTAAPGWGRSRASAQVTNVTCDAWGRPIAVPAGPDAAALREMKKRGIDTSRWEKS